MEDINYKLIDTEKIKDYIRRYPEGVLVDDIIAHSGADKLRVLVDDIIAHSGADKLRVYPALFELEQAGWLEVTEREELGAAKKVRIMVNG